MALHTSQHRLQDVTTHCYATATPYLVSEPLALNVALKTNMAAGSDIT